MRSLEISLVLGAFSVAYCALPSFRQPSRVTAIHSNSQIQFKAERHPTAGDDIVREIADIEANPNEVRQHPTKGESGSKTSSSSGGSSYKDKKHSWAYAVLFAISLLLLLVLAFQCLFSSPRATESE